MSKNPEATKLLPHDEASEAGALACVLTANGDGEAFIGELLPEYFHDQRYRTIFDALRSLARDSRPINIVELDRRLRDQGEMKLAECAMALPDATPSPANFPSWIEILRDRHDRRRALSDADEMGRIARNLAIPRKAIGVAARTFLESWMGRDDSLPLIVSASEFMSQPIERPPELIQGIVHRSEKLVLGGGSKSFKTWALLDLSLSIATGSSWMGFDTTQGSVLFINFEIPDWAWQERIKSVALAKGIDIGPELSVLNLRGRAAGYDLLLPKIAEQAQNKFALIVLDPIYKLYGDADENKAGDVARLMNAIDRLSVDTGAAVAFGAHFSKGNQAAKESIDRISGSGVFARDPDSLLILTRHEEDNCFTVEPTLRTLPPIVPFTIRWNYPRFTRDEALDPSKLKQAGGKSKKYDPIKLLAYIRDTTQDKPVSFAGWARLAGVPRTSISDTYASEMRARGWIATVGDGMTARQFITQKGKEALETIEQNN